MVKKDNNQDCLFVLVTLSCYFVYILILQFWMNRSIKQVMKKKLNRIKIWSIQIIIQSIVVIEYLNSYWISSFMKWFKILLSVVYTRLIRFLILNRKWWKKTFNKKNLSIQYKHKHWCCNWLSCFQFINHIRSRDICYYDFWLVFLFTASKPIVNINSIIYKYVHFTNTQLDTGQSSNK